MTIRRIRGGALLIAAALALVAGCSGGGGTGGGGTGGGGTGGGGTANAPRPESRS
jgi:hypothetical protein